MQAIFVIFLKDNFCDFKRGNVFTVTVFSGCVGVTMCDYAEVLLTGLFAAAAYLDTAIYLCQIL